MITLALLGRLRAGTSDGREIPIHRANCRELLAFLALHRGMTHQREHLAFALWPDVPAEQAKSRLRQAMYWLQVDLGLPADGSLFRGSGRTTVELNNAALSATDLETFAHGARIWMSPDSNRQVEVVAPPEAIAAVLELYRGPLGDGIVAPWISEPRRRFSLLHAQGLQALTRAYVRFGHLDAALDAARNLVEHVPRQSSLRTLMDVHLAREEPGLALRACARWRGNHEEELRAPDPATSALADDIRRRYPSRVDTERETQRLIGRLREHSDARETLLSRRFVTVCGAPGVGKTRFAIRLAESLAPLQADGLVLVTLPDLVQDGDQGAALQGALAAARAAGRTDGITPVTVEAGRGRAVFVFDAADACLDAIAQWIPAALGTPGGRFIVTSREPLAIDGEAVVTLRPLSVDDGVALLSELSRAPLDIADARRVHAAMAGLPLGLRLAAASIDTHGRDATLNELAARPDMVVDPMDTGGVRHRSMGHAIATSWARLTYDDQAVVVRLARIGAPASIEDLIATGPPTVGRATILSSLLRLVRRSLVDVEPATGEQPTRYVVLRPIATFVCARWAEREASTG